MSACARARWRRSSSYQRARERVGPHGGAVARARVQRGEVVLPERLAELPRGGGLGVAFRVRGQALPQEARVRGARRGRALRDQVGQQVHRGIVRGARVRARAGRGAFRVFTLLHDVVEGAVGDEFGEGHGLFVR